MQTTARPNPTPAPADLCGYPVDAVLTPEQTFLARGPGGRRVVLKKLDEDCMLRGNLHPSIRDRLSRVRELAHAGVANLHGVGRDGNVAYLIWEYVQGSTFDEHLDAAERKPRELLLLARELILCVESLHMQGIVHGAMIGSNVIVASDGSIRLTHVSPLLYTDPAVDVECVVGLLSDAVEARGEQDTPLGRVLSEGLESHAPLRVVGTQVAALLESRGQPGEAAPPAEERRIRRRMIWAAALIALIGTAVG
ncbi:MAG TPA: protein kinase, partial [Tepidisphaeraceae bacterium]|nr:protein kinase [Tepidisphaeraceae bacterium]